MFNQRSNSLKDIFQWLLRYKLNHKVLSWLLENRAEDWEGVFEGETVESMQTKDMPWMRKFLITGIQDFLDALKYRKNKSQQSKNIIPKDPYLFEILNQLGVEFDSNQRREELERLIEQELK